MILREDITLSKRGYYVQFVKKSKRIVKPNIVVCILFVRIIQREHTLSLSLTHTRARARTHTHTHTHRERECK